MSERVRVRVRARARARARARDREIERERESKKETETERAKGKEKERKGKTKKGGTLMGCSRTHHQWTGHQMEVRFQGSTITSSGLSYKMVLLLNATTISRTDAAIVDVWTLVEKIKRCFVRYKKNILITWLRLEHKCTLEATFSLLGFYLIAYLPT